MVVIMPKLAVEICEFTVNWFQVCSAPIEFLILTLTTAVSDSTILAKCQSSFDYCLKYFHDDIENSDFALHCLSALRELGEKFFCLTGRLKKTEINIFCSLTFHIPFIKVL